ncbi:uncharacterized protein LOC111345839 [Stylophora pistillata]|uniref:uncharacterized protein LOC111345839 n=1 Tax=Stylophora pistillata TaxID=50429 RepID=UPI000C056CD7|nr:uncharacterized protein LOC111345839 [Stylophora pistillata]
MTTDKVQGLIKTVKDTRDVLEDICKEETQSVQEKMLKENVEGHLRIARGSLHDVFFKISVKERMSYIAHSRELARAKEAKCRNTRSSIGQSKISAANLRAIQTRLEGLESSVTQPLPKKKYGSDMAKHGPYMTHIWEWYGKIG